MPPVSLDSCEFFSVSIVNKIGNDRGLKLAEENGSENFEGGKLEGEGGKLLP